MESEIASTFAKHAPYIGALILVVVVFLRYLTHRDNAWGAAQERRDATWAAAIDRQAQVTAAILDRYALISHEQMAVLRENSAALAKVATVIQECTGENRRKENR